MQNIKMSQKGDVLTIEIDTSKRGGVSASGKSLSIASTGGNVSLPNNPEIKIGINCYTPKQ